jgi:hypothetical protein
MSHLQTSSNAIVGVRPRLRTRLLVTAGLCLAMAEPVRAGELIPPKSYVLTPGGVNAADGSFTHVVTDLAIGSLKLERFHRTGRFEINGDPMERWRNNFYIYVASSAVRNTNGGIFKYRPVVNLGTSSSGVYTQNASSLTSIGQENEEAVQGTLVWNGANAWTGGNYVYTDQSGTVYTFTNAVLATGLKSDSKSQRVARIDFPDGRVQTFTYTGNTLKLVQDSSGYAIVFDTGAACGFNTAQTYVSASTTCSGAALKVTYNGSTQVTDVLGQTTTYELGVAGVTCIKPPGTTTCEVTNVYGALPGTGYTQYRVTQQTLADSSVWQIASSDPTLLNDPDAPAPQDGHNEVSVTDPANKSNWLTFTKTSPFSMTDANNRITSFRYRGGSYFSDTSNGATTHGSFLVEAVYPEGNKYLAEYNGPYGSVSKQRMVGKPGPTLSDRVVTYGYNCTTGRTVAQCTKPIWVRDANSNASGTVYQTDYDYASHGGLLYEMKPAPAAGAARPLKLASWIQKYAYVKNSSGALVPASAPIWVITSETQCQTVAGSNSPVCDGAAQQTVTAYQYGADGTANNLLVRGVAVTADGTTLRTCYGYDGVGNRISETKPRAGLAVCP